MRVEKERRGKRHGSEHNLFLINTSFFLFSFFFFFIIFFSRLTGSQKVVRTTMKTTTCTVTCFTFGIIFCLIWLCDNDWAIFGVHVKWFAYFVPWTISITLVLWFTNTYTAGDILYDVNAWAMASAVFNFYTIFIFYTLVVVKLKYEWTRQLLVRRKRIYLYQKTKLDSN